MDETPANPEQEAAAAEQPEQVRIRREKRDRLIAEGRDPYPVSFPRTVAAGELHARFSDLAPDTATGERVGVAGRVVLSRPGGKLCFATLQDGGDRIQVMLSLDRVGADSLAAWKVDTDLGDLVGVEGEVVTSRRGELSVLADRWQIVAKALRPLPEKWSGLSDPEARVRQRYVDLVVNPESREILHARTTVMRSLRATLEERGFLEVETPMLQAVQGGATARPFLTHINAYDLPLYLRIAPELYLKRLVVGGVERVFELNRNFRNEGADRTHNPEFTMLEAYEAYGDYDTIAELVRTLYQNAVRAVFGGTVARHHDGTEHDFGGEWRNVTMYGVLSEALNAEVSPETPPDKLARYADQHGVTVRPGWGPGRVAEELFDALVPPTLVEPTFVRDYPVETSPLTKKHRSVPGVAEKWDLYVQGVEAGTGYSELTDPVDQRERFEAQARLAATGDLEAMDVDEDFLRALEHGMPPTGGTGFGLDRMMLFLTGRSLRETMTFPLVKPE